MNLQCNGSRSTQLAVDYLPRGSSSMSGKKRRTRVQRTNTLSGVTDQARKVLDELLVRGSDERDVVKKEIPFSAPTPYEGPSSSSLVNGHWGNIIDALSPLTDDDTDRVDGGHKRRPSQGLSTVLGDSSPSPVEPNVPDEIVNRKKKTFFVRAKERLRETMRRQEKKPVTPSDEKADLETPSVGGGKKTWRLSFKTKKHKKIKKAKENNVDGVSTTGVTASSKRTTWPSSTTSKDSKDRLSTTVAVHPIVTPAESASQANSLPNSKAFARDIRGEVPVRSRSTDETRLQPLGPDQQAILRRYLSTVQGTLQGKSRTSDPRPSSSVSSTQQSDSVGTSLTIPKAGRTGHYSLRKNLHLEGLVTNLPAGQSVIAKRYVAPLAVAEDSQITPDDEEDIIDGLEALEKSAATEAAVLRLVADSGLSAAWSDRPLAHATSKPFSEKSKEEREELYGRIAEQLDLIGDSYCFGSSVDRRKVDEKEASVTDGGTVAAANAEMTRTTSTSSLSEMTSRIGDLMRNTNYDTFQRVVNRTIGSEPGIEQIAAMFRLTKCAVHLVGIGTTTARSIKELAIRYFEDHFAPWVVDEGGWESVVEDSTTDMDLD